MFSISYLDVSGALGILACCLLTLNFLMGMLLSVAYVRLSFWKKLPDFIQKLNLTQLHNYTAYIAWLLVLLHASLVVMDKSLGFSWQHLFWGLGAPKQPIFVWLGSLSMLGILLIIITTQKLIKKRLGFRLWKNIHLLSYLLTILFFVHGIFMDPLLKDRSPDWLDAEKFIIEMCAFLMIVAFILRIRFHLKQLH
ncbi:MAG: ferric reductase-like transmembrane domain-containing protein [Chitinophagia bacterium]|jgi:DMSO/TMAO reductase YedYZ heme-binding membrane subunit